MESTLDRLITTATTSSAAPHDAEAFLPSASWTGPKPGYYFGTSERGTGYHLDVAAGGSAAAATSGPARKRARLDDDAATNGDHQKTIRFGSDSTHPIPSRPQRKTGEELLAEAESALSDAASSSPFGTGPSTVVLTPAGIRSAASQLEKIATTNEMERAQYPDQPEKFLQSEVLLNDTLDSLRDVAAAPSLYVSLIKTNVVETVVGLLAHANGDVAATVLSVLNEWLAPDLLASSDADDETAIQLGKLALTVMRSGGGTMLEMMVSNLGRYDEEVEEEQKAIDELLTCVENLLDLDQAGILSMAHRAMLDEEEAQKQEEEDDEEEEFRNGTKQSKEYKSVTELLLTTTTLLSYLVQRISAPYSTDFMISLHSSEVLSSLLQQEDARVHSVNLVSLPTFRSGFGDDEEEDNGKPRAKRDDDDQKTLDGMECLLQAIAPYRKRDPKTEEEVEILENIYDALAASLLSSANVQAFLDGQGIELMLRCIRNGGHGGFGACKVLHFASSGPALSTESEAPYKRACEILVEAGGLKQVFPMFMGRSSAIPTPASCSDAGRALASVREQSKNGDGAGKKKKKSAKRADAARKEWLREVEGNAIRIVYELTRHLDVDSPNESKNRVLAKFLEGDCEKCDRLVELCLKYDARARLAEYQFYRSDEAEEIEQEGGMDIEVMALNAKLKGGGDIL